MGRKKILIIDDNEQDRKIEKIFLNKEGFEEIIMAETGEEGVKKVQQEEPDIIILDTMLPGIDGFETCRQIRKTQGPKSPKIVILTGSIDAIDALKAKKVGADDYCVKTSDSSLLIETVKNFV